nr:hypothetical protein [Tanacetum cinerariifolium]
MPLSVLVIFLANGSITWSYIGASTIMKMTGNTGRESGGTRKEPILVFMMSVCWTEKVEITSNFVNEDLFINALSRKQRSSVMYSSFALLSSSLLSLVFDVVGGLVLTAAFLALLEKISQSYLYIRFRFCNVNTSRTPPPPDPNEPSNVSEAIASWGVGYVGTSDPYVVLQLDSQIVKSKIKWGYKSFETIEEEKNRRRLPFIGEFLRNNDFESTLRKLVGLEPVQARQFVEYAFEDSLESECNQKDVSSQSDKDYWKDFGDTINQNIVKQLGLPAPENIKWEGFDLLRTITSITNDCRSRVIPTTKVDIKEDSDSETSISKTVLDEKKADDMRTLFSTAESAMEA